MADMQQLERAFLKAHKAGDTKAAGVLAAEIKRQRASQSSAPAGDAPVSGLLDQFMAGAESNTELPGQTLEAFGKTAGSSTLEGAGKKLRDAFSQPQNFVSAADRFTNPKPGDSYVDPIMGLGWGNAPGALAEVAGQAVGDAALSAGGGMAAGPAGAVALPALMEFMRAAGPIAMARAKEQGLDAPTWKDWEIAAGAAGLSGVLNGIGIKGIGILNKGVKEIGTNTATQVVRNVAKETGKKALKEGVTEAGQSVIEQGGSTIGTPGGLKIDLKQAVGEGILGAGAGGTIDAGRNIRPTIGVVNDIRSVNSDMRNNPDAQSQAEVTLAVNDIASRMSNSGKAPVAREINNYVSDLKKQINEVIDGQNLEPDDKKALKGGMQDAAGLTPDRVNEIASRSDSPDAIKALIRKIQVVREMTVQKQTAKGARGWAAQAAKYGGGILGGAVGAQIGGYQGAAAGAYVGQSMGEGIARRLRGNQTQGNNIDKLIGKKQARRAAMLLDRYGPSEATTALNTLTEKAAANKMQAEADAAAKKDFEETMSRIRYMNSMRQKSQRAVEQANTREEKAKAAAEKQKYDLASREERLKAMAYRAQINKARAEQLVQNLEAKKSLNALTIEMAQTRKDFLQKTAEAKADKMNRDAKFQAENLKGKLEMLALDIAKRQEALKKAEIATKRAEKMASRAPASAAATVGRIRAMPGKWAQSVQEDGNIDNKPAYQSAVHYLDTLRQEAQNTIKSEPNEKVRNFLRETLSDILSLKNNWDARAARFERAMREAQELGGDVQQKLHDTLYQLAHYKVQSGGREDFGSSYDPAQDIPF